MEDPQEYYSFHPAASEGDIDAIKEAFDNGADIEARGHNELTPLLAAVNCGKTEAVRYLLDAGADFSAVDDTGKTSLHYAVLRNQRINVSLLLEYGAPIDAQTLKGYTPLCLAAERGFYDIVRLLLNNDADAALANYSRFPPLHLALAKKTPSQLRILAELLWRGSDPDVKAGKEPGFNCLEIANMVVELGGEIDPRVLELLREDKMERLVESFLVAAEHGRSKEVARLLERGVDVNHTNASGQSALHLAAQGGHKVVNLLLEKGAAVDHQDENGHTALWWAAFFGHDGTVKSLLEYEAQVDLADESGFTPLSMAARKSREKVADLLIQAWAQVDIRDNGDRSPFMWAVVAGSQKIVEMCLKEANWGDGEDYDHFNKALETADRCGHVEIAELLLENGAQEAEESESEPDVEAAASQLETLDVKSPELDGNTSRVKDYRSDNPRYREFTGEIAFETDPTGLIRALGTNNLARCHRLLKKGINVLTCKTSDGHTPLIEAAAGGHLEFIDLLLDRGVSLEARNNKGQTALWQAAHWGKVEAVRLLLKRGADIEAKTYAETTPLATAAAYGREDVVRLLVEKGARTDSTDLHRQTPLSKAVTFGHDAIVGFLFEHGADIEHRDKWGRTPLHISVVFSNKSTLELLLKSGVNLSARMGEDSAGDTVLNYAARDDQEAMVLLLLAHGADPNDHKITGMTSLHSASLAGNSMMVKLLIENGANAKAKDVRGISPLCAAKMRHDLDRDEVVKILARASDIKRQTPRRYEYTPISGKKCIRLLELQPGLGKEIIQFDLFEVDLDDEPPFEALSYEWGERSGSIPVQCGNTYLLATPNLKAVLRRLRRPEKKRLIWIDALCINQESIPEKNQQVPLMTQIYRTTYKVNMWLGESETPLPGIGFKIIKLFHQLYEVISKQWPNFQNIQGQSSPELNEARRQEALLLWEEILQIENAADGLTDVFARGYFTRAWIFQEIILANDGVVMCGEHECELEAWEYALYAMTAYASGPEVEYLKAKFPDRSKDIQDIAVAVMATNDAVLNVNFLANLWHMNSKHELFTSAGVLSTLSFLQAGDPRDKVYAAIGVLKPHEQEALAADYNLTAQEVYIHAARHMFNTLKIPRIWGEHNRPHQKAVPNLPSWVPDWSSPQTVTIGFHAWPPSVPKVLLGEFTTDSTTLEVNGYILDHVAYTVSVSFATDFYDDVVKPIVLFLAGRNISIFDPCVQVDNKINLFALWNMLVRSPENWSGSSNPKIREAISYLAWRISTDQDIGISESLPQDLVEDVNSWQTKFQESSKAFDVEVQNWVNKAVWYQNDVLVFEKGGFGATNGHKISEAGMVVAILGGIEHLCVLRKREEKGEIWYEYVEAAVMDYVTDDWLEGMKGGLESEKERLKIR
ncbi:ankyrin repeat-containing domain protein [Podospora fimiseda]|uniref:Ankyrin repeat-containing domain protein n=1 Tax=Podospora fimiseda TaxID=252190 RepID=A0AAN7GYV7_9PEZI|nr:ankyrin repeat-containing domain protein [Podospora fimiseda]